MAVLEEHAARVQAPARAMRTIAQCLRRKQEEARGRAA
jgi:hypothetical protein